MGHLTKLRNLRTEWPFGQNAISRLCLDVRKRGSWCG